MTLRGYTTKEKDALRKLQWLSCLQVKVLRVLPVKPCTFTVDLRFLMNLRSSATFVMQVLVRQLKARQRYNK